MTRTLLVAPHADDETLFASYLAQKHAAHVVCVYDEGRVQELGRATAWLGCTHSQLLVAKGTSEPNVERALRGHFGLREYDLVVAPAERVAGHEEHNIVGRCAERIWQGKVPLIRYLTYAPRGERDRDGREVVPDDPSWYARKLAALSCYRTPIATVSTRPWFVELLDVREWMEA